MANYKMGAIMFSISWSDIPNKCVVNLIKECGMNTYMHYDDMDVHVRNNMNIELAKYHTSEFTDNPVTDPIYFWWNIDFPNKSYYTMFLLRWS